MKGIFLCSALLAISLAGTTMGQVKNGDTDTQAAPQKTAAQTPAITLPLGAGTAINASLVAPLDSERNKPGDSVTATVTEAVVYQRSVLLPKGTRIEGHVVRTGTDSEQGSAIFVEFDKATLPNGQQAALNAGIQALAPPAAPATIPSRKEYEEDWIAGNIPSVSPVKPPANSGGTVVLPSTFTNPRKALNAGLPEPQIEGGLDRQGRFTPDSKGAFGEPSMRIFTPVSEGSHGTVLLGAKKGVRLEGGTHLLIVIQPPNSSPDVR